MPGWVIVFGLAHHLGAEPGTQAGLLSLSPPSVAGWNEYRLPGESWESKQARHVIHQPVSVVSQCGAGVWLNGLVSGDQRRLTGSSASEACS